MRGFNLRTLRWAAAARPSLPVRNRGVLSRRSPAPLLLLNESPRRCFSACRPDLSLFDADSTIYALSTAPGRAAIAVVRVSGPACVQIYNALCPSAPLPRARHAAVRTLYDPLQPLSSNTILDAAALVLYFPGPRTVTGEDVLELHLHGGPAIVKSVLTAIANVNPSSSSLPSSSPSPTTTTTTHPKNPRVLIETPSRGGAGGIIRYAEPGEFTRRAFLNNRLDLPQIEALGEILHAETEQQRRIAVRAASSSNSGSGSGPDGAGALSQRYEQWRHQLLYARGELEALIDFAEDQHFDESPRQLVGSVGRQVRTLQAQIRLHIGNAAKGELLRSGIRVALLGAPNAGKSSLLNRVVGREAAIVSTEEGTTRDIVDVGVDVGGWFVRLGDMAGIRSEDVGEDDEEGRGSSAVRNVVIGAVEKEGIRRAKARALESDVVVVVVSLEAEQQQQQEEADSAGSASASASRLAVEREVVDAANECARAGRCVVVAINKCDRLPGLDRLPDQLLATVRTLFPAVPARRVFGISCLDARRETGSVSGSAGHDPGHIQRFLQGLIATFEELASPMGIEEDANGQYDRSYWEDSLGVTHRQSSNLQRCLEDLDAFMIQTQSSDHDHHQLTPESEEEVDIVTAAEHLRSAADALAKITGKDESGDVEDVLGVVFEKFCVGK
ncbi:P-loop containing nucleoside triphosphate hydrolase protein [Aspergillus japonicus CBS 114.51]|uniref:P-loop containing nucleoside triphosphate hydrolase protein n=1 Tax=Aspergillus japonicus CBS 114.51 TaxID=1448312 RepID=A0A8T8WWT1_ASPJA|nr:P-loop containing nucleoside triphosphate hydrolase protein [Aspergillus japonicus CBS 114.51]RAH80273.1 P-loop containing nucleoside triphosphate hydrolase protein [Aspergillus japonicus CBS 114.51]